MSRKSWWQYALLPLISFTVVALDRLSKQEVLTYLRPNESWAPIPWLESVFTITHVTNTGAAFGLFPRYGSIFMFIAIAVTVAIAIYYWQMPSGQWLIKLSLGFQLGGALGNLIDRLAYGHVIDFIYVKMWPVFNLADTSIVVGVGLLALALLREAPVEKAAVVAASEKDTC